MKAVKAHVTGNKDNIYIDPCTNTAFIDPTKAVNADKLQLDGVNHICIEVYADNSFKVILHFVLSKIAFADCASAKPLSAPKSIYSAQ